MKFHVLIVSGLLVIAAIVSLVLGKSVVLIVVALVLGSVVFADLMYGWSSRYSEETERYRERWLGKKTTGPTYYCDEGDEEQDSDAPKGPR